MLPDVKQVADFIAILIQTAAVLGGCGVLAYLLTCWACGDYDR